MNSRRKLVVALAAGALAPPLGSFAQKKSSRVYRIGILFVGSAAATARNIESIQQGLREHGYVDGQTIIVERRHADGKLERLPELAAELARSKMDVIVAATDPAIAAVKQETQTIPIVMGLSADPVGAGFVASLARPGGNITGLSTMSPDLSGKRLELLKEIVPAIARVAIIWNPEVRGGILEYNEALAAARTLRLQLQSVEVRRVEDVDRAFSTVMSQRAQGLIVQSPNPVLFSNRSTIVSYTQRNQLPAVFGQSDYAQDGGLMSYGSNVVERYRNVVRYVDKILKGAKPADLPVEQPTKFELVINLKAAKALKLTIPQTILVRADRVIE